MDNLRLFPTFAVAALALCAPAQTVEPDQSGMELSAQEWCREIKMGWNLGNSLESSAAIWTMSDDNAATGTWTNVWITNRDNWETGWGNPATTLAMIQAVKAAGFDAIRIPVIWAPHVTDYSTMEISATWMARVKEVVDWCIDEGLYVVINAHHEQWLENNPYYEREEQWEANLKALWTQIATYFRDYGTHLAFAGTNEVTVDWAPPTTEQQAVQNKYNQWFVDAVRATGGKNYYRNLIVQTYACSQTYGLSGFVKPTDVVDGHLAVEFHYYEPYDYCSGNTDDGYYYWGTAYRSCGDVSPSSTEASVANVFKKLRTTWAQDMGLGIVVGEYGVSHHYTTADQATQEANEGYYLKTVVSEARRHGMAAFVWDNSYFGNGAECFGIFNRSNNMSIDTEFMLNGIKEGAQTEYSETVDDTSAADPGAGGTTIWEGSLELDWAATGQHKIAASEFSSYADSVVVVLYYTQNASAVYEDIQLYYGDWSALSDFSVDGIGYTGDFNPQSYYGTNNDDLITAFVFDATALAKLKSAGLIIFGYGVTLTKIVLNTQVASDIETVLVEPGECPVYDLLGRRVKSLNPNQIYIRQGRKFFNF